MTSLGVVPTLGRSIPVTYLMPFLARKRERSTSLRIDSARPRDSPPSGGIVSLPGADAALRGRRVAPLDEVLEPLVNVTQARLERGDLPRDASDVAHGRQTVGVPDPHGLALDPAAHLPFDACGNRRDIREQ